MTSGLLLSKHSPNMTLTYFVVLGMLAAAAARQLQLTDEEIDAVNSRQTTWRAGRNFPPDTPDEYIRAISNGVKPTHPSKLHHINTIVHDQKLIDSLPETFDPTTKWPNCPSLKEIRDQSGCGSCWAFGAVEAMTDRWCIHSNGSQQFRFSSDDLAFCAGETTFCFGCNGGFITNAWQYWVTDGIVSGGQYGSGEGCRPYEVKPGTMASANPCKKQCLDSYRTSYSKDKRYGKSYYRVSNDEDQIRAEIYKNGPVETGFIVYIDFMNYHSGVYIHDVKLDIVTGLHAVKIIGWGVENGTKYWHVANSWGTKDWGKLGGFFKILRGENHCNIETDIWAGEPLLQ